MKSVLWETLCNIHGNQETANKWNHRSLYVGKPKNKRDRRHGGCPRCKSEKES